MQRNEKPAIFIGVALFLLSFLFSNSHSQDIQFDGILQADHDLVAKYNVGDRDFYHIRTVYLEMNDSGRVANTRVLDGHFSREVLRFEDDKRYDHFIWKHVKIGQRQGKGELTNLEILPYSQGFQYEFSEKDMTPEHFPVNLSSIPKTMEGYQFFVKLLDAHTFDIISNFENYENTLDKIGQTAQLPGQDLQGLIDFPPLFTDSHFAQTTIFTTFQGITLYRDQPCALLAFRSDDSRIHMVANMMGMRLPMDATSYYWGDIILSLNDGKILKGQLFEYVISTTSLGPNAEPARNVIRREITLEKISQEIFDGVDSKSSEPN